MNSKNGTYISEAVEQRFVGRADALEAFYLRFSYRHMKNGIYYYGEGGLGKTWVLKKIILEGAEDSARTVTDIIDFLDTQHHTIRGLQTSIKARLQAPQAFEPYDMVLENLGAARQEGEKTHPSVIASLEARANRSFIECCHRAIAGREVVVLFDTFERVQQREVGQWLLQVFLPQVRSLIVVIAGRPAPRAAQMPYNIVPYELEGLGIEEVEDYVHNRHRRSEIMPDVIEIIQRRTGGSPLLIDLILDLSEHDHAQFMTQLEQQENGKRIQDSPDLQRGLVGQFALPSNRNQLIWAMSYLKRRFDVRMLKYIVEHGQWFRPGDYAELFADLGKSLYVKEYPEQQSHLLHDEIQRMVAEWILAEVADPWKEMRKPLFELIVQQYYPEIIIKEAESATTDKLQNQELARQLKAEQLGYILDENPRDGFKRYEDYRKEIEVTYQYDFEELLWGEVREHLDVLEDKGYQVCLTRGQWLQSHSLFPKAAEHYRQMIDWFPGERMNSEQALGFMLLRQGEVEEAIRTFEASLINCVGEYCVREDDFDKVAMIENNLGQASRQAGKWDEAIEHYARSFRAATKAKNHARIVSVYINRGYLYSLQGHYRIAQQQCERALELLSSLPSDRDNIQRTVFAWMNLGTAYRHLGDYATAAQHYQRSLELATAHQNREAMVNVLEHLGINAHLLGRASRRTARSNKGENLRAACEHQHQAWQYLIEALEMARESGWRNAIAHGLNRLAKIYREVTRLQEMASELETPVNVTDALQKLEQEMLKFEMPFEVEYEHDLLTRGYFAELDWLEKAARLFEISALVADEVNDFHRALDSWTELGRLFIMLDLDAQVTLVIRRIERIKGYDYQETLFAAMNTITQGDLDFKQGKYESALNRYKYAFAEVAKQSGYASYLLTDRLRDLEWLLRKLPRDMALDWCDVLEQEWLAQSVFNLRPDMLDLLERIRLENVMLPESQ